jgi:hypothetical protein
MVQRGALEALLVRREEATRMIEGFLKIVIIRDLKVLDFVAREVSQLCLCVLGQLMDTLITQDQPYYLSVNQT